jgi:hypothetical protein
MKLIYEVYFNSACYGLKSIISSLSVTLDLSPGLHIGLKKRALALNSSLFLILNS